MKRRWLVVITALMLAVQSALPSVAGANPAIAPIVDPWQIAALSADGYEFWIQYTFTSDGIVWVFVPDGRHGSGHWDESSLGTVTMSFAIQSGTEGIPTVERIWEQFPMPVPGASTWASQFSYFTEDIDGNIIDGGPSGSVVARRFDVRPDLAGVTVTPPPSAAPSSSPTLPATPAAPASPSTDLTITTLAATPGHFDRDVLRAPAGVDVTVTFDNQSKHLHDIAFFAGDGTDDPLIARTQAATGPAIQTVTFTTPATPGRYLFVCELHPGSMTGFLEVG